MTQLENAVHNNAQLLRLLRDEIALKAHLLKQDAKDRLAELDAKMAEMKEHLARAEAAGAAVRQEAEAAAAMLADTLRDGYKRIRDALTG
ncbi:MAG TPA: hypothetical protein VLI06_16065 [Solimonas sp.]|nr:hypothetical protein [Solimonas sp.]